ncbi:MAG TPA: HIT family protein [Candidatus Acidoferrales bacterium]|nr:HIT family protein [Candidatus Acidoferrales bacterium]
MNDCIFCKIIAKEAPSYIIDENDDVIVFLAFEGHPLVVTKKHFSTIYNLDDVSGAAVMKAAVKVANALKKSLACDGVNVIQANEPVAGQDVMHFHMHIIPRWKNDSVNFGWELKQQAPEMLAQRQEEIKKAL